MKFRHYLEQIADVKQYPMTSLLIFFLFFTALAIWAIKAKKSYIERVKNLPLDSND